MRKFVIMAILLVAACNTQPPNQNPVIASFNRNPSSGAAPLSVTFSWTISDPNSDALTCKVDVNNDGSFEFTFAGCTSNITHTHAYTSAGTFTAKLRVEDGKGGSAEQTVSVTITSPPADAYDITLRFSGTPTAGQQAAFTNAASRWSQVITTGFASLNLNIAADACGPGFAAFNGSVDDILIDAQVVAIDGVGGILGQAGPCLTRTSNNLTLYGVMKFDSADIANLESNGQLVATIFHEMGHVMGVGTLWNFPSSGAGARNLLQGKGTTNPRFVGTKAVAEWQALGGTGNVPVENCLDGSNNPIPTCGAGTKDSHWREAIFNTEIMTGLLDAGTNPLSRMTIGSIEDLGYTVNYGAADPFTLLKAQSAQNFATKQQLKVELITPMGSVGP